VTVALAAAPGVIEKSKPLPVSATVWGLLPALSVIFSVPVLVPPAVGSKKTPIVQLEPTATGLLQLLSTPKSAALGVAAVTVRAALPVFVTVKVCGRPLVPTYWLGNVIVEGDKLTAGAGRPPVPVRVTICGLPGALSAIVKVPVRLPLAVGVKVTGIWQASPAATEVPQLLVCAKSPEIEIAMLSAALPALYNPTVSAALVVPTC
jgi:hypothetical protein